MARRRLTFGSDAPLLRLNPHAVPRAEHGPALPLAPAAPIAHVAADAAGAAALQALTDEVARARDSGRLVLDLPLDAIAADHLTRDRLPAEDADMGALRESLRRHGQRTPVEVTPLVARTGTGALPYGLISGWRRLQALKALHAETRDPRFATVQALVRRPETAADAYVTMVEENEIRLGLSHYERARVAALATARGVFPSEDDALRALFATASRPKRSRIRSFLEIFHALDGSLRFPAHLPERLGLALVERLRAGERDRIAAALAAADPATPEAELAALAALLATPKPAPVTETLAPGLALESRLKGRTLTLKLSGDAVTPALAAEIRALLDRSVRARLAGVLPEALDLVHPLVQDGDDTDVAVRQPPPVDEVVLVAEHVAVDAELRRHRPRHDRVRLDSLEGREQPGEIVVGLRLAPAVPGVAIDRVEAARGGFLDADGQGQRRLRAMTSAAVSGR